MQQLSAIIIWNVETGEDPMIPKPSSKQPFENQCELKPTKLLCESTASIRIKAMIFLKNYTDTIILENLSVKNTATASLMRNIACRLSRGRSPPGRRSGALYTNHRLPVCGSTPTESVSWPSRSPYTRLRW
ncbi:hypothetical protein EVAR_21453_1 [Eumeta japonica]|uniref:Uncharacterized protein n=1 Tax=Eumeta variegata TaxID=151549 RepID=A0A4C1VHY8_EUMVA|nr:hypothetical protein EVAR_21453_1 [Eumeta japonica]